MMLWVERCAYIVRGSLPINFLENIGGSARSIEKQKARNFKGWACFEVSSLLQF